MTTPAEGSKTFVARVLKSARARWLIGASAAALIAVGASALFSPPYTGAEVKAPAAPATVAAAPRMVEAGAPFSFADLVERVSPAVVAVSTERGGEVARFDLPEGFRDFPPFRDFFDRFGPQAPQRFRSRAQGSGFIIDKEGYIVTNNHVVDGSDKISVQLTDGREFDAKLVGHDDATDVALIKIEGAKDLPSVAFGDDRKLRVGDWVVAVGNPFGLGGTVTAGIVSSIGRDIGNGPYTDYIQIDAPINRGNSGGPTFDLSGRVVGMNTAIFSPTGGSVGIGFAIPASTLHVVVDELKEHGGVTRGWLGVQIQSLTPDMAAGLGAEEVKGAIVAQVVDDSPAAKAGFKQGDVVTAINGQAVEDSRDLTRRVAALRAGAKAEFTVLRDGKERTLAADIAKRDEDRLTALASDEGRGATNEATGKMGLALAELTSSLKRRYGVGEDATGVLITAVDPSSEAAEKGLRPGEIIVSVGNRQVATPDDVRRALDEAQNAGRRTVLFLVTGEQGDRFVALKIAQA